MTVPSGGPEARRDALMFVQGLTAESMMFDRASSAPTALLLHGLASLGLVTVRADKRSNPESTDFDTEVEDFARVLEATTASPRVLTPSRARRHLSGTDRTRSGPGAAPTQPTRR